MPTTRIYGGVGGALLPLTAADIDGTELRFVDPAQELLAGLISAALAYELDDPWAKVIGALPPDSLYAAQSSTSVVGEVWRTYPSKEHLSQNRPVWPLLAIVRDGEGEVSWLTRDIRQIRQKWGLTWMIGPVGRAEVEKLQGVLPYFVSVVESCITKQGHIAYESGKVVLNESDSPFLALELTGTQGGLARIDEDGPQVLAVTVTLEGIEQSVRTTDHLEAAQGLEWHEDLRDGASPVIADFVVDETTCGT